MPGLLGRPGDPGDPGMTGEFGQEGDPGDPGLQGDEGFAVRQNKKKRQTLLVQTKKTPNISLFPSALFSCAIGISWARWFARPKRS